MKRLVVAYFSSIAVSLLALAAVMSPALSANDALLSGKTGIVVGAGWLASFALFWVVTLGTSFAVVSRVLNAIVASAVLPVIIVFAPLLFCIFVSHGTCS